MAFGYDDQENTIPEQGRNDDAQKMIKQIYLSEFVCTRSSDKRKRRFNKFYKLK